MRDQHLFAGFWRRVHAFLLDTLVLLVPSGIAYVVAFRAFEGDDRWLAAQWLTLPLVTAYDVVGNGSGGTLGKRWIGLRVIDQSGAVPGFGRAFVRVLPVLVVALLGNLADLAGSTAGALQLLGSYSGLLLVVDDLWMIWDPRKQTLHDKLAGTFVVEAHAVPIGRQAGARQIHHRRTRRSL